MGQRRLWERGNAVTDPLTDVINRLTAGPATVPMILCRCCGTPKAPAEYYPSDLRRNIRRCRACRIEAQQISRATKTTERTR